MNRLVIIGNGFDIAHGLPTKYCDFINDFWRNINLKYKHDDYRKIIDINESYSSFVDFGEISSFKDFQQNIKTYMSEYGYNYQDSITMTYIKSTTNIPVVEYKNQFFRILNDIHSVQNWVDVENEYYILLKNCLSDADFKQYQHIDIQKLNKDFNDVKNLFEEYLRSICVKYDFTNVNEEIKEVCQLFDVKYRYLERGKFLEEFPADDFDELKQKANILYQYKSGKNKNLSNLISSNSIDFRSLFLSFNYTPTIENYMKYLMNNDENYYGESEYIYIHGKINDEFNRINFGFGDEMDDAYKLIENKGDNKYLKYIKSFQYLQNHYYKYLLDFIDSEKFQVYVMGHSCGLSDRILLNTIFEHENCRSIKIYFHEYEKPKDDGGTDDYTNIIHNISRHFNDKKMMRKKIVNKTLCQPLPQNVRFVEKQNSPQ